jgi:hypothetical protein
MPTPLRGPNPAVYNALRPVEIATPFAQPAQQSAGPNAALLRLGLDEQRKAAVNSIFQQYGDDYDGAVKAVMTVDPELGLKLGGMVEEGRKQGAAKDLEVTKSSLAKIDLGVRALQVAAEQPDQWPTIRGQLLQQAGESAAMYDQVLPQPGDPQLQQKLTGLITGVALPTKQYLEVKAEAAQLYFDGKKVQGALTLMAGSKTPEQWTHTAETVKAGGLGRLLETYSTPEAAATALAEQAKTTEDKAQSPAIEAIKQWTTEHGRPPTYAERLQIQKQWGQADDRPRVAVTVAGGGQGTVGGLTTGEGGGLEYAATVYRLTQKMPVGLARGGGGPAVINEAAKQTRLMGQKPVTDVQRSAARAADTKSLAKMTAMQDAAGAYENKAQAQLDIVDSLSDKVGRTSIPMLNRAILAGQTEIAGDADATLLLNAVITASTEYAKIMSGGTGSAAATTDSAQKEAQKLLSAAMSPATLRKATALMRQEMGLTMQGYQATIEHINDRMSGQPAPAVSDPLTVVAPNGKTYKFTTPEKAAAFKKAAGIP